MTKRVDDLLQHLAENRHQEWYQWATNQRELTPEEYARVGKFDKKRAEKAKLPKVSGLKTRKSRKSNQMRLS